MEEGTFEDVAESDEAIVYLSPSLVFNLELGEVAERGCSTVAVYPYSHPHSPVVDLHGILSGADAPSYLKAAASCNAIQDDTPALAQVYTVH